MDKIEKIRQEIERRKLLLTQHRRLAYSLILETFIKEYDDLLSFLDTLSEEPDKNLEEEVKNYFQGYWPGTETAEQCNTDLHFTPLAIMRLARHFANWQKEQFEKNRLAHCDGLTKEECDRETDFAMEIIEKEHRQPTFTDAINYGMRLQKEQMLKEAVEGTVSYEGAEGPCVIGWLDDEGWKDGQKVKLLILPSDE